MARWRGPDGWRVESLTVERGGRRVQRLRASWHGRYMGEAPSVDGLAELLPFPLAELVEDDESG